VLDLPEPKLYLGIATLGGIRPGFAEHFMRHVYPDDATCVSYGTGRKKTIKACPATEIEDGLSRT
jgi:hypothetical protein